MAGYIHDVARFFEVLNGGSLHPDYELTLKPTSGYMLRAYSTRTMKKTGINYSRGSDISHVFSRLVKQ